MNSLVQLSSDSLVLGFKIFEDIRAQIFDWSSSSKSVFLPKMIIQFGSSVVFPPKICSDIDVLFVCESLPKSRQELWSLTDSLESTLEKNFKALERLGFSYHLSPLFRSLESLQNFSYFYLDFPDCHIVILDKDNQVELFLAKIIRLRERYKARKVTSGSQVVWDLTATLEPGQPFEPVFQ